MADPENPTSTVAAAAALPPSILTTDLTDHLALITGSTGGIGRATALALARLNCPLALHYHGDEAAALALVATLTGPPYRVRARAFQCDLSAPSAARELHDAVVRDMDASPTIVFSNAGTTGGVGGVETVDEVDGEVFERTWRVNCLAGYELVRECLPTMVERGWGRVVFCSSVAGFTGGGVGPHYASSKSALHGLIHWLAGAYAKKGVTVNGVAPALIEDTKMLAGANTVETMGPKIPVGRLGRAEEVAELVVYLVKSGYMTNKVIGVDGGIYVQ